MDDQRDSEHTSPSIADYYAAMVSMAIAEGDRTWNRFNIMCVLNTGLVAVPYVSEIRPFPPELIIGTSIIGVLFCCIWGALNKKGFDWYSYFIVRAQEAEQGVVETLNGPITGMGDFARGEPVKFVGGKQTEFKLLWPNDTVFSLTVIAILLFGAVHVASAYMLYTHCGYPGGSTSK